MGRIPSLSISSDLHITDNRRSGVLESGVLELVWHRLLGGPAVPPLWWCQSGIGWVGRMKLNFNFMIYVWKMFISLFVYISFKTRREVSVIAHSHMLMTASTVSEWRMLACCSIQISHEVVLDHKVWDMNCCLPRSAWTRSKNRKWSLDLNKALQHGLWVSEATFQLLLKANLSISL